MAEKKLTIRVDETIYNNFKALCEANGFKVNNVIVDAIAEPNAFIKSAIDRRDKAERAKKVAQIKQLKQELGLSDADLKKLLKDSEQTEMYAASPADSSAVEDEKEFESRRAHQGTYEDESVTWEVDKYTTGYFCRTSDGKLHKKDVNGTLLS